MGSYLLQGETPLTTIYGADVACGAGGAIPIKDVQRRDLVLVQLSKSPSDVGMSCTFSLIARVHSNQQGVMVKICHMSRFEPREQVRCDNINLHVNERKPFSGLQTTIKSPASHSCRRAESRRAYRSRLRGR